MNHYFISAPENPNTDPWEGLICSSSSGYLVVLLSYCLLSQQQSLTKLGVIFPWGIRVSSPGMRTTPVPGSLLVPFRPQFNEEASDSAPTTALTWPFAQEAPAERFLKTSCLL